MSAASDLTADRAVERKLRQAVVKGIEADLHTYVGENRGCISAQALKDVCIDAVSEGTVRDPVVVVGAHVQGLLDLAQTHLTHAIHFRDCVFDDGIDLRGAQTTEAIEWEKGRIGKIQADRFKTTSDLTIRNVDVTGQVSLHWANIGGDLCFTGSQLEAKGEEVVLNASDVRVGHTLFLDGAHFQAQGEVCLRSSHIKGDVDCRHAHFNANGSHYSINAAHAVIDGELLCEQGFFATGEVCLHWAQVDRLRATGGRFSSETDFALHATAIRVISGAYLDRGFHATGQVRLIGANITGDLCCTDGRFDNPGGVALNAQRIVADDVYLDGGFTANGEVRFVDAHVAHEFNATHGVFHKATGGDYALDADGLHCGGDVYLDSGFEANGAVSLKGAEIGSELNCTGGHFTSPKPHGCALFADGLTTPGTVYLDMDFRASGVVRFARATVGRQLVCTGGFFENEGHVALDLAGLVAAGDVLLNGSNEQDEPAGHQQGAFYAIGKVILRGAKITRDLDLTDSSLGKVAELDARGVTVGGRLIWKMAVPIQGSVDLSRAEVGRLDDDSLANWPEYKYMLDGMTFRILDGTRARQGKSMSVEDRIRWLDHTSEYSQGAYRQLAESYRLTGDDASAEKILIACQRHQRTRGYPKKNRSRGIEAERRLFSKGWNWLLGFTVGYGYRLHRVFIYLLALWALGWLFYWLGSNADLIHLTQGNHPSAAQGCQVGYPCFYPFVYSLQMLIPGLDLREATYWIPNAGEESPWGTLLLIYTWVMIISGWIAATVVAAGLTRVFRRR